jgi:hypothetical protein
MPRFELSFAACGLLGYFDRHPTIYLIFAKA